MHRVTFTLHQVDLEGRFLPPPITPSGVWCVSCTLTLPFTLDLSRQYWWAVYRQTTHSWTQQGNHSLSTLIWSIPVWWGKHTYQGVFIIIIILLLLLLLSYYYDHSSYFYSFLLLFLFLSLNLYTVSQLERHVT